MNFTTWQDWTLFLTSALMAINLIPLIRSKEKPPLSTSIPTAAGIIVFTIVDLSLHLWLASVESVATSLCWWLIAIQTIRRQR